MKLRPSVILETMVDVVVPVVLLVALYFLLAGHNRPGGGFIGGLVAGAAFVLRFLAGKAPFPSRRQPDPLVVMGLGVALAAATAMASWLFGAPLLDSGKLVLDLPWFGEVKAYSVLAFDTGVFLVVVGMVLAELDVLGPEDPSHTGVAALDAESAGDDDLDPADERGRPS